MSWEQQNFNFELKLSHNAKTTSIISNLKLSHSATTKAYVINVHKDMWS